jgi:hypothetical protein
VLVLIKPGTRRFYPQRFWRAKTTLLQADSILGCLSCNPVVVDENTSLPSTVSIDSMTVNMPAERKDLEEDLAENEAAHGQAAQSDGSDIEKGSKSGLAPEAATEQAAWDWDTDAHNPYNWPSSRKAMQVAIISSIALLT